MRYFVEFVGHDGKLHWSLPFKAYHGAMFYSHLIPDSIRVIPIGVN